MGKPRVLYTDLDSRLPRLSSIEGQYKTFERSVPHISVLLRFLRSYQPVVPPRIASKHSR
jgi:hypothetical protein